MVPPLTHIVFLPHTSLVSFRKYPDNASAAVKLGLLGSEKVVNNPVFQLACLDAKEIRTSINT